MASTVYDNSLLKYRYEINVQTIIQGKNSMTLDSYLTEMTMYNYYDKHVFPVIQLEFNLTRDIFYQIQQHADTVMFALSIKRFAMSARTTNTPENSDSYDYYMQNVIIKPFDINRTPLPQIQPQSTPDPKNPNPTVQNPTVFPLKVDCFFYAHLEMNKKLITAVLDNCTPGDAILYALNTMGVNNILIDSPDNTATQEQILLPGFNLTRTIEWIQEVYGVYITGMRIFFDINYTYILNRDEVYGGYPAVTASGPDSWEITYIDLIDQSKITPDLYGGYYDYDNSRIYMKLIDQSSFITNDTSARELNGEYIKVVSRTKGNRNMQMTQDQMDSITNDITKGDPRVKNGYYAKEKLLLNRYGNPYAAHQHRSLTTASGAIKILVPWSDLDMSMFNPNKRYQLSLSNPDYAMMYNGAYHINSNVIKLSKGKQDTLYRAVGQALFDKLQFGYFRK
jgi:hypothetical protein